jgi:hypothetical protein
LLLFIDGRVVPGGIGRCVVGRAVTLLRADGRSPATACLRFGGRLRWFCAAVLRCLPDVHAGVRATAGLLLALNDAYWTRYGEGLANIFHIPWRL